MSSVQSGADFGRFKLPVSTSALKLLALALVVVAAFAVRSTARVFSGTVDEPAHIAAGMQWLTSDRYDYDLQHPPLGRIAVASGPYLQGTRGIGAPAIFDEGASILGSGERYVETLASARAGVLVFFVLLAGVVWVWARDLTGPLGASIATVLLVTNPTILAHSGLATTDMSCAATTVLALFAASKWLEQPTWARAAWLGTAIAAAVTSRLSALAFVGGPLVVCYVLRGWASRRWQLEPSGRPSRALAALGLIGGVAAVFIWAMYEFAVGPSTPGGPSVPAPAFVAGVSRFLLHGSSGHPTFLLGTPSNRGWWYYFPVALLVKTPLPLLLCALLGGIAVVRALRERRDWIGAIPLVAALSILLISLSVKVNLGIRLILPVYPLLAIAGAQGIVYLLRENKGVVGRAVVALLLASAVIIPIRAHPDHLAYFNPLAGDHPENVLVDSNLDWGQDLYRLRDTIRARGIRDSVRVAYFGTANLTAAGVPNARELGLRERASGWIAASETYLAGEWVGRAYSWLLDYEPVARIGPSMRLWHIPDSAVTRGSSPR